MQTLSIVATRESWPLRQAFTISRGSKLAAEVVYVVASDGTYKGHGEAVPYARYGETVDSALAQIRALPAFERRDVLSHLLPAGAARNAVDCALVDLEAKRAGITAASLLGMPEPVPVLTCYTLSLGTPDAMAAKAALVRHLPLLKLKLGGAGDAERIRAVRAARPDARLVADANEGWTHALFPALMDAASQARIELIEQPLPAGDDDALRDLPRSVPVCADESLHTRADLTRVASLYDAINIKLDKAGGLIEALALKRAAEKLGLRMMIGSMVATSLAAAPAMLLTHGADWVDLDGPLLLAHDREPAIKIESGVMSPASPELWG